VGVDLDGARVCPVSTLVSTSGSALGSSVSSVSVSGSPFSPRDSPSRDICFRPAGSRVLSSSAGSGVGERVLAPMHVVLDGTVGPDWFSARALAAWEIGGWMIVGARCPRWFLLGTLLGVTGSAFLCLRLRFFGGSSWKLTLWQSGSHQVLWRPRGWLGLSRGPPI